MAQGLLYHLHGSYSGMKVALTIWEKRISPVFDSATMLMIAEIDQNCEKLKKVIEHIQDGLSFQFHGAWPQVSLSTIVKIELEKLHIDPKKIHNTDIHFNSNIPLLNTFTLKGKIVTNTSHLALPNNDEKKHITQFNINHENRHILEKYSQIWSYTILPIYWTG